MVVPALPRRYVLPLACAGLSASVTLLLWLFTSPGIDAPSHLFQTWLFSHGGFDIYNNYWYAGRYEFVNYSMLYYAVAAQVGQLGVLFPASALLGGCFALVCSREWASAARGPSITFAVTAPFIMMVGGTYPFLAGVASSLLALALLQRRRRIWFGLAVLVTLAFSPLSFSLLCAVLAGVLLGKAQPLGALRSNRAAFGIVLAVFVVGVLLQRAFPSQGWYPYDLWDALIVLVFSLVGLWIAGTSRAHPLDAGDVRRLPGAEPVRLPAEGPDRLESQPPVRDRRGADAVADGEPEPAPIAAAGVPADRSRRGAAGGAEDA